MPIALNKVTKKIRRKKGALTALGDRDKKRVQTATLRDTKLKKQARARRLDKQNELVRAGFFKVVTKDATAALGKEQVRKLIESWINRDLHELARFIAERRPGRAQSAKHLALQHRVEDEREEFRTGFWCPDLTDYKNVEMLKRWDGTAGSLAQVRFGRIMREDVEVGKEGGGGGGGEIETEVVDEEVEEMEE